LALPVVLERSALTPLAALLAPVVFEESALAPLAVVGWLGGPAGPEADDYDPRLDH